MYPPLTKDEIWRIGEIVRTFITRPGLTHQEIDWLCEINPVRGNYFEETLYYLLKDHKDALHQTRT